MCKEDMVISGYALPTSSLIYRKTYQEIYHSFKNQNQHPSPPSPQKKNSYIKHVKTNFTAALPNNVLHFISHLSLTSLGR